MNKKRMLCLLLAAALLAGCVGAAAAETTDMYVRTGNTGKLHLRSLPSVQADSLGLFANGTKVSVDSKENGWAHVTVNGQQGYMLLTCLSETAPAVLPQPVPTALPWAAATPVPTEDTTLYISTGNSGKLHLREQPATSSRSLGLYPNGTAVQVTARVGNFAFVRVNGLSGYMMLNYLSPAPGATAAPTQAPATPAPFNPGAAVQMVVRTGNTGKLHLREKPTTSSRSLGLYPNGTVLQAVNLGSGWAQVQVGGVTGYMMLSYLTYVTAPTAAPTPTPTPTPGAPTPTPDPALPTAVPTPVPTAAPSADVIMYVATGNSGKLHLRENISMSSASLGLYPNGTAVTVHGTVGNWYQVTVAGKNGYMMRTFLTSAAPAAAQTPIPGQTAVPGATAAPVQPGTAIVTQPNNSFVNLRSYRQSEADNVIARVPSGTVAEVLEWGDTWCRVRINGQEGWMISWYLKK